MSEPTTPLCASGLFVVGAPRSGTTVLQNALNASNDVFMVGEANFYRAPYLAGFRSSYNAMHRRYGNQPTKSSYCPALCDEDASAMEYLLTLRRHHRWVGDKLALGPRLYNHDADLFFEFACRHFYDSVFLFIFRDPGLVLASCMKMFQGDPAVLHIRSQVDVMILYLDMLRTMKNVYAVFHEDLQPPTFRLRPPPVFQVMANVLGTDLAAAGHYLDKSKVLTQQPASEIPDLLETLRRIHSDFRAAIKPGTLRPLEINLGIEQKLSPSPGASPTRLGNIYGRLLDLRREIARHEPAEGNGE